jgi:V8-like Glu-specific endopeptidase
MAGDGWSSAPNYGAMGAPTGSLDHEPARQDLHSQNEAPLLDAWYAAHGQPALAALLRRPAIAAAVADLTLDGDDRARVAATEGYPWRCICLLKITAADGSRWLGTGWLAGPRTLITAGHCVYLHRHGGWAYQIEVAPGQNGDLLPYGSTVATGFRSVRGWIHSRRPDHNYGAIILPADRAFGNLLGYFGYSKPGDPDLQGALIDLAGYPCDRPPATQWRHSRRLDYLTPRTLEYAVDSIGGHSGAPVWRLRNGAPDVVGIHANSDQFGNAAIRISAPVFANISAWKREGS